MSKISPDEYGPRLYSYLEKHWRAKGTSANGWALRNGLQLPTLTRWRDGAVPSLAVMRDVADALEVTMLDVLIAAGVVDAREAQRELREPPPPSIDAAISGDPALTDLQRRTLRDILESLRKVEGGQNPRGAHGRIRK